MLVQHLDESVLPEVAGPDLALCGRALSQRLRLTHFHFPQLSAEARKAFPKLKSEWL